MTADGERMLEECRPPTEQRPWTVVIAEDHASFASALEAVLSFDERFEVAVVVGTTAAAIEAVQRLQPDVALVDIGLPDGSGADAVPTLRAVAPDTRLLLMSGIPPAEDSTLRDVADGFLDKADPDDFADLVADHLR